MEASPTNNIAESKEIGSTGIFHLKRLWAKAMLGNQATAPFANERELDTAIINILGLGLLPSMNFCLVNNRALKNLRKVRVK